MVSDESSTQDANAANDGDVDSDGEQPTMDDLTGGDHDRKAHDLKAHDPEDVAAPQQVAEAQAFMARNSGVHGYGIGQGADGGPCMVLFADDLPADQVPESLDGLPVRVEASGEFTAGG